MPQKPAFRLILTAEQTAALADGGPRFSIAIIHPGSWPDSPGRMILDLIECDRKTADQVAAVADGRATIRKQPRKA